MKEFNDLLSQFTRIGDMLERLAVSTEQIAAAQGVPAAVVSMDPAVILPPPAKKRGPKPTGQPAAGPLSDEVPTPVEVPQVESMFDDDGPSDVAYTADDVKNVLTLAMKAIPEAEVARIFREHNGGVARLSLMKPEFYGPVIQKFQEILEKLPG